MIYCAFVHSYLICGIEMYEHICEIGYLNKLMILNNKILCILQHCII